MGGSVGVLLMHHGAPAAEEEVPDFLARVTGGRASAEATAAYLTRFRRCGGSPQAFLVDRLAEALETELRRTFPACLVTHGSLYGRRSVADAALTLASTGASRVVAVTLVPQRSLATSERYMSRLNEAVAACGLVGQVSVLEGWASEPHLVAAYAARWHEALAGLPPAAASATPAIFTAHSLPLAALGEGDPFLGDLQATAAAVARSVGSTSWQLAFQSPGRSPGPWLGPLVGDALRALAQKGEQRVVVVPIHFLFDNMETLYDLDVELRGQAEGLGVELRRAAPPNDSPLLVAALAALVSAALG
jgi:ferrochelatase